MNFPELTAQNPVGDFVNHNPDLAVKIFGEIRIDYCCGGGTSLARHCQALGLDPAQVLDRLNRALPAKEIKSDTSWTELDASGLIDHILETHHQYLEEVLPEVTTLMSKALQAHGKNHPEFIELEKAVRLLIADLLPHMRKEEQILFPMIRNLEDSLAESAAHCGSVANPIRVMLIDHEKVGRLLEQIRGLTGNFSPPEDTCQTVYRLYQLLKNVEADTHLHVHKENNLLFPLALELAG